MQVQVIVITDVDSGPKTLSLFDNISSLADVTGRTLCKDSAGKIVGIVPHSPNVISIKLV
jgi:hypothetical protein